MEQDLAYLYRRVLWKLTVVEYGAKIILTAEEPHFHLVCHYASSSCCDIYALTCPLLQFSRPPKCDRRPEISTILKERPQGEQSISILLYLYLMPGPQVCLISKGAAQRALYIEVS